MKFLTITPKDNHLHIQSRIDGVNKDLIVRVLHHYDLIHPQYEEVNFRPSSDRNSWFYIDLKEYGSSSVDTKILNLLRTSRVSSSFEKMIGNDCNSEVIYQYFMFTEYRGNKISYSVTSLKSTESELNGKTSKYTVDRYVNMNDNIIHTEHNLVTSHHNLSKELHSNLASIQDKNLLMYWMEITSSMILRVAGGIDK